MKFQLGQRVICTQFHGANGGMDLTGFYGHVYGEREKRNIIYVRIKGCTADAPQAEEQRVFIDEQRGWPFYDDELEAAD